MSANVSTRRETAARGAGNRTSGRRSTANRSTGRGATKYDALKIENQLCFPLYACSRGVIKQYTPLLDEMDLTYTQYITMMVLWEKKELNVKQLGQRLYLDSGTLTPLLKKLEKKGMIERHRSQEDERNLIVSVTESGEKLKDQALNLPKKMLGCMNLTKEETKTLYDLLYKILHEIDKQ